jgi:hypothetical protein
VTLQIGAYTVTIPAGSFKLLTNRSKAGAWVCAGTVEGVSLNIQIAPLTSNNYQLKANGGAVNIGSASPVAVS